jgi:hypothetical protein
MSITRRVLVVAGLLVITLVSLVFVGTNGSGCLGPLGRTVVPSLADGCTSPYLSPGVAIPVALLVLAFVVAFDAPVAGVRARLAGAMIGAVLAVAVYALERTTTMTGPTSTGAVITVTLPFDPLAATIAALIGGGIGWMATGWVAKLRRPSHPPAGHSIR